MIVKNLRWIFNGNIHFRTFSAQYVCYSLSCRCANPKLGQVLPDWYSLNVYKASFLGENSFTKHILEEFKTPTSFSRKNLGFSSSLVMIPHYKSSCCWHYIIQIWTFLCSATTWWVHRPYGQLPSCIYDCLPGQYVAYVRSQLVISQGVRLFIALKNELTAIWGENSCFCLQFSKTLF